MKTKTSFWLITLMTTSLFIAGCGGQQLKVEAIPASANPTEVAAKLEKSITNARRQQVNTLSPTWFSKAGDSLAKAAKLIASKGEIEQINNHLAQGAAQLKKAEEMAELARKAIPDAIKRRELARTAGATAFEKDYAALEEDFLDLTRAIENNNLNYAQSNRQAVADGFRAIEIRAIKEKTIGVVRKILKQAEKEDAKRLAPKQLSEVRQELQRVEGFIAANPYATEKMQIMAGTALFHAKRLLQLTRQSAEFQKMSPIDISLWTEDLIASTARNLGAPDMRDQPFETQKSNILGTAKAVITDRQFLVERNSLLAQEVASLKGLAADTLTAKEQLAAEKRFNELYSQVQALFTSDEAESYKQGREMVIRLRGMNFPVGQSVIMPENYPLLSKVQNAIRIFEGAEVTIEGHTDSQGSEELNLHLSQKRAEAVQNYLLANQVIAEDKINATGYGLSRPLAPNTTAEGRAQNRRIDIIITP